MRICGVDLSGREAVFVVLDGDKGSFTVVNHEPRRIELADSASAEEVRSLSTLLGAFFRDNDVKIVVIRARAGRGEYMGSATSFKIEGLIQLCEWLDVQLLPPQTIAAVQRKERVATPKSLRKYQEKAFLAAYAYLTRSGQSA